MPTAVLNGRAHDVALAADDADSGARPRRRDFTAEYKPAILAEYDTVEADSSKGSILRRGLAVLSTDRPARATRYQWLAGPLHGPPRPPPTPPILRATYAAIAYDDDAWETEARDGRA